MASGVTSGGPALLKETAGARPAVRIGLLRLTDAAPVVVALENGYFADQGLKVALSVEPSWANIADKLTYGQLDAAVILPPLAFAVSLGLRGAGTPLIVPMSISLNGNSVTVTQGIAAALGERGQGGAIDMGRRFARHIQSLGARPRIAVVHVFSTHNLLLRYWLAAAGIDPERDIEISIVPPASVVDAMADGQIDGFCAGAPWGELAARRGTGRTIVASSEIWRNHPEKCFAVRRDWAEANPARLDGIMDALLQAARVCDTPANADAVAALLGRGNYLALDPAILRASLAGGDGVDVDRSIFFAGAANFPWRSHAAWFLAEMTRWGYLARDLDRDPLVDAVYRPDLFRAAAERAGLPAPRHDGKDEGAHAAPWMAEGVPDDIAMPPDSFCDGRVFTPQRHRAPDSGAR
jgi:NitT/TauT family transport system ATP-binding protein/nitrate/nitrite transport system substrate-binding protein